MSNTVSAVTRDEKHIKVRNVILNILINAQMLAKTRKIQFDLSSIPMQDEKRHLVGTSATIVVKDGNTSLTHELELHVPQDNIKLYTTGKLNGSAHTTTTTFGMDAFHPDQLSTHILNAFMKHDPSITQPYLQAAWDAAKTMPNQVSSVSQKPAPSFG